MPSEVIAAVATPPGRGAIGVLRLSGSGCLETARRFLELPEPMPARRPSLVWAADRGRRLDRVLATLYPEGASYTGEELLELSAHGSPYVLRRLLELCRESGARDALPGEFTQRAYLNGRMDLAQAEAVCDLISARTELAHRAAVSQLEGGLSRRVRELRSRAVSLLAWTEACIDHPDEDLPPLDGACAQGMESLASELDALARTFRRGRLVKDGVRIVIAGAPNAGKSSLLNALLGSERALTDPSPGTTRDTVEAPFDLDGLAAVLVDTAGLGVGPGCPLERAGMERTRRALRSADLVLHVADRTARPEPLEHDGEVVTALNKSDLPAARLTADDFPGRPAVEVSALTGRGIEELVSLMRARLADSAPPPVLLTSARHYAAAARAADELRRARETLSGSPELAAEHLRRALDGLDSVTGGAAAGEVLDEVFSRFCVGK